MADSPAQVEQARRVVEQPDPLFLFPLLGHLKVEHECCFSSGAKFLIVLEHIAFRKVRQCLIDLLRVSISKNSMSASLITEIRELRGERLYEFLSGLELTVERPELILLGFHLLHRQRDGTQPGEPVQAPFLQKSEFWNFLYFCI